MLKVTQTDPQDESSAAEEASQIKGVAEMPVVL
jgi:hypothetical protein